MSKTLVVQPGDCLINLSRQEGFFWETLWNHPQNADLRQRRKQYNIIKKDDQLFVPDKDGSGIRVPNGSTALLCAERPDGAVYAHAA